MLCFGRKKQSDAATSTTVGRKKLVLNMSGSDISDTEIKASDGSHVYWVESLAGWRHPTSTTVRKQVDTTLEKDTGVLAEMEWHTLKPSMVNTEGRSIPVKQYLRGRIKSVIYAIHASSR